MIKDATIERHFYTIKFTVYTIHDIINTNYEYIVEVATLLNKQNVVTFLLNLSTSLKILYTLFLTYNLGYLEGEKNDYKKY